MLLKLALVGSALLAFAMISCNREQRNERSRSAQLVGKWELQIRHDCKDYPIQSDIMILHPDGTFDQHTVTKDGRRIDSLGQHWAYMEKDSVSLDKRRDWDIHSDPSLRGTNRETSSPADQAGRAELQVLIVQFGSPPVILINPDSDCVYVKTK